MTQYLVAIHLPDDYDPSGETEAMSRDIDALNDEMEVAGVRIFVGGLQPASSAKSLRAQPDGKVLITDGPYLETKEHIGGFWVLEAANLDDALAWGAQGRRRLSGAGRGAPGLEAQRKQLSGMDARRWYPVVPSSRLLQASANSCEKETQMRKLKIIEHISLDGVGNAAGSHSEKKNEEKDNTSVWGTSSQENSKG